MNGNKALYTVLFVLGVQPGHMAALQHDKKEQYVQKYTWQRGAAQAVSLSSLAVMLARGGMQYRMKQPLVLTLQDALLCAVGAAGWFVNKRYEGKENNEKSAFFKKQEEENRAQLKKEQEAQEAREKEEIRAKAEAEGIAKGRAQAIDEQLQEIEAAKLTALEAGKAAGRQNLLNEQLLEHIVIELPKATEELLRAYPIIKNDSQIPFMGLARPKIDATHRPQWAIDVSIYLNAHIVPLLQSYEKIVSELTAGQKERFVAVLKSNHRKIQEMIDQRGDRNFLIFATEGFAPQYKLLVDKIIQVLSPYKPRRVQGKIVRSVLPQPRKSLNDTFAVVAGDAVSGKESKRAAAATAEKS